MESNKLTSELIEPNMLKLWLERKIVNKVKVTIKKKIREQTSKIINQRL